MKRLGAHLGGYLILCALAMGGCGVKNRRTPDNTIVFLMPGKFVSADPRSTTNNYDVKISRLVVPGLTTLDNMTMEPVLHMAQAVEEVAPLVWRATLKSGLKFSTGAPVTAQDVEYTFQSLMEKKQSFREKLVSVRAIDTLTTEFTLHKPLATFMADLDFGVLSKKDAEAGEIVGAGPYALVSFHGAEKAVVKRNPHYFGEAPPVERIEFLVVRDDNARALMLAGGSADITQNGVRVDLVNELTDRPRLGYVRGPSSLLTYLMMQNEDPILKDVRVRRAIAHAVDRQAIVRAKFHGYAVLATGMIAPSHWAYNGEVPRYEFNPEKAKKLLDEAGYPDPEGPAPRMKLTYKTSASQFRVALARLIADQLGDVGIEVDVQSFEFSTFFADIKKGNYQLGSMQTGAVADPDAYYYFYHSSRIPTEEEPNIHNRWRYRNARLDELTELGRAEMSLEKRKALYGEVQHILARDVPVVPLWHEDNIAITNADLTGYTLFPNARVFGLAKTAKKTR